MNGDLNSLVKGLQLRRIILKNNAMNLQKILKNK